MEPAIHHFSELFAQLGLPNGVRLPDAPFWSPSQARFLKEALLQDPGWAEQADQLGQVRQSTARFCLQVRVLKRFSVRPDVRLLGERAAWPIEPPSGVRAALPILAMARAIAAVCALPEHPMTARSTMPNCLI